VALVRLEQVQAGYSRECPVLQAVSLEIEPGQVCVVLGPNGAGKSTLVRVVMGLLPPHSGRAEICGLRLPQPPRVLSQQVSWVPQVAEEAVDFTGLEVALMGVSPRLGAWGLPSRADEARALEVLAELDVAHLARARLSEVSGGERRRVWLARALMQQPKLLVLDEPTAFLDVRHQVETLRAVRRRAAAGLGVLAVLHDVNLAAKIATHLVLLKAGRVLATGPAREVLTSEHLSSLYDIPMRPAQLEDQVFSPQWAKVEP
jgi:iron complex transport system ATP-binding protein